MGRIKTKAIKRITEDLVNEHGDVFKEDFETNKRLVQERADIPSKKLRNILAGYVTRLMRSKKDL